MVFFNYYLNFNLCIQPEPDILGVYTRWREKVSKLLLLWSLLTSHVDVHSHESQTQIISFKMLFHQSVFSTRATPTTLHSPFLQCKTTPKPLRMRTCIGFRTQIMFLSLLLQLFSRPPNPFSRLQTWTQLQHLHSKQLDQHVLKMRFNF